jgi:hypothetical protein
MCYMLLIIIATCIAPVKQGEAIFLTDEEIASSPCEVRQIPRTTNELHIGYLGFSVS